MKTRNLILWLIAIFLLGPTRLWSQGPAVSAQGRVLLLTNDRLMEGEIERVGNVYIIRRGNSAVSLPADRAKRLFPGRAETLAFMLAQTNLGDPDERLRLARWCQANDLLEPALDQARAALEMRPAHPESKYLVRVLENACQHPTPSQAPAPMTPGTAPEPPLPAVDIHSESEAVFLTRVLPILMNTCAGCHHQGQGGAFQLYRAHQGGARAAQQRNLAIVIAQLNLDRPAQSPLLTKAVSKHHPAMVHPPLPNTKALAYLSLLHWVENLALTHPHLKESQTLVARSVPIPKEPVFAPMASDTGVRQVGFASGEPGLPSQVVPKLPLPLTPQAGMEVRPVIAAPPASSPPPRREPADPFDPLHFNKAMHPDRKAGSE